MEYEANDAFKDELSVWTKKETMMSSDKGDPNRKIIGLQFIKFLPDTLSKT